MQNINIKNNAKELLYILINDINNRNESVVSRLYTNLNEDNKRKIREEMFEVLKEDQNNMNFQGIKGNKSRKKGLLHELMVGNFWENKAHISVIYRGIERGANDGGIDLVAINTQNNATSFIQCKNWNTANNYKIEKNIVRKFIDNCKKICINEYKNLEKNKIYRYFYTNDNELYVDDLYLMIRENNLDRCNFYDIKKVIENTFTFNKKCDQTVTI